MKPTFVDLQVNGHGGIDFLSARSIEEIRVVSRSLFNNEVLAYLPTIITCAPESAIRTIKLIEEARKDPMPGEAKILGIHLEGPFISFEKRGAHPREFLAKPDLNHIQQLLDVGLIKVVTLAPELPGAIDLIKFLVDQGVIVSLGHSNATSKEAEAGFNAGARTVTHLFNAMPKPPLAGLAQVAIAREDILIQIIIDNIHVSKELLAQTLPKIINRFIVTNDTVAAAGLGDGVFPFGDMEITVTNGQARKGDGSLAGGVMNLRESLKIMKELGITDDDALTSVTTRPADLLGIEYASL